MQEQILGDYKILKQVGQGTLGIVLLAEHRFIKKQYILKVLPQELCEDRGLIQRFEEEVVKLASLDHPHIVKIHNVSFAEGQYFLVTDCIVDSIGEMTNLAQYMSGRKERLREDELISVLRQIADALDYAHTKGQIVHRSLKLNNILIGKHNQAIEIFITDFGLSKVITAGKIVSRSFKAMADTLGMLPLQDDGDERYSPLPIEADKLSQLSHSFLQSYAFLAPEQKKFEHVGVQADSYAFGVLAYYLIAGYYPEGIFEMPSSIAPEYGFDWDNLILQCLKYDPNRRPTQLLSLLEKKRPQQFIANEVKMEPRIMKAEDKERAPAIEQLKERLLKSSPAPKEELAIASASNSLLKPMIKPSSDPAPQFRDDTPLETVVVESKDVSEATSLPINPPEDRQFTKILNTMLNRDPVVTEYQPEKQKAGNIEPLQTEMIVLKGGDFVRGSNSGNRDEMPRHRIYVDSFALDIHPVSNEQFVRFLEYMGGEKDPNYNDLIRLKDSRINRSGGKLSIESGYAKHPVVGVTWYGSVCYAKWVGKRLPTEGEWEIAARGGLEGYPYPTGENIEKTQANFFSSDTTPVMSYAPNAFGLFDMAGNVYEWCHDWYGYNYYEASAQEPYNPKGPLQGVYRVLRGGCWKSLKDDMRCSHRHRNNPGTVNSTYGFRCAADVCASS